MAVGHLSSKGAARLGAVAVISRLVQVLGQGMVPYLHLLVVPMMSCMGDQEANLRLAAAASFGRIVALLPLTQASIIQYIPSSRLCIGH